MRWSGLCCRAASRPRDKGLHTLCCMGSRAAQNCQIQWIPPPFPCNSSRLNRVSRGSARGEVYFLPAVGFGARLNPSLRLPRFHTALLHPNSSRRYARASMYRISRPHPREYFLLAKAR